MNSFCNSISILSLHNETEIKWKNCFVFYLLSNLLSLAWLNPRISSQSIMFEDTFYFLRNKVNKRNFLLGFTRMKFVWIEKENCYFFAFLLFFLKYFFITFPQYRYFCHLICLYYVKCAWSKNNLKYTMQYNNISTIYSYLLYNNQRV